MVNLVGMTHPFREAADDFKARLLRWIADIEGHAPGILDARARFPCRYRLHASDLIAAADRERDIDPVE